MVESEAEKNAWRNLVQANVVHKGHDTEGQGSPITQIVLEYHANKYQEFLDQRKSKATEGENPSESS